MSPSRSSLIALAVLAGSLLGPGASADPVLSVAQISGGVKVDHLGETHLLTIGDELHDRDVVRLDDDAYLSLRFSHEGALDLGPGAALAIERLPGDESVPDLRSIFSLWKGYMHVSWRRPAVAPWPLYVYFGGQRSSLVDGEYFFARDGARTRSCVAAGRLTVTAISGTGVETLRPSACYEMPAGGQPKIQARTIDSWAAVRRSFTLDPDPARPVQVFAVSTPEPAEPAALPAAAVTVAPPPAVVSVPAPPQVPIAKPAAAVPTPAPTPAPAASAPSVDPAAASGAGGWAILIGSYADPTNAAQVQQKLIAAGFTPLMRVKIVDGKTWNSVQVRGFASREAAQQSLDGIVTRLALPNLRVVLLP